MNEEIIAPLLSWDHNHLYYANEIIAPNFDSDEYIFIELQADQQSLLDWQEATKKAYEAKELGKKIIWKFFFGLDNSLDLDELETVAPFVLAVEHFAKNLYPQFFDETFCVLFYEGIFPYSSQNDEKKVERIASFFSQIAAKLPFEAASAISWKIEKPSLLVYHYLFSGYFEHFLLFTENFPYFSPSIAKENSNGFLSQLDYISPTKGLCLPFHKSYEEEEAFLKKESHVRIIPEHYLCEQWDGLDLLYYSKKGSSEKLMRKLAGFEAAGGKVELIE